MSEGAASYTVASLLGRRPSESGLPIEETETASKLGVKACKRYSCLELPAEYAVQTPMCTVIHRSGLVVRNGHVADLATLIPAMLAEPLEPEGE